MRFFLSRPLLSAVLGLCLAAPAFAQKEENIFNPGGAQAGGVPPDQRLTVEPKLEPAKARRGEKILLKLVIEPAPGFHTYPFTQEDPNVQANVATLKVDSKAVALTGVVKAPPPHKSPPAPEFNAKALGEWEHKVETEHQLLVKPDIAPGVYDVKVRFGAMVCDDSGCVPVDKKFDLKLTVTDEPPLGGAAPPPAAGGEAGNGEAAPPAVPAGDPKKQIAGKPIPQAGVDPNLLDGIYKRIAERMVDNALAPKADAENLDFWAFVLSGAVIGFISLLTPCVFPMIPITVSFFLKQSENAHHKPVVMALVYCATIIVVLTASAMFLLNAVQALSQNAYMNFFLGGLFIFFALSLFGWYEIELPSGLARFTSAREGQGGYLGTVFMALTFTILSFACVAPFLGGFAGAATQSRPLAHIIAGSLAFSFTFAAPFFFLALFPGFLRKMPRSGSWLNSVKVVMGFLEAAAAFKFLRAGELAFFQGEAVQFFTYDFVLCIWIGLCLLCAFYLMGVYRLPHDSPAETISVARLGWATLFVTLAVLLFPALTKAPNGERLRPAGSVFAWLDAFLLDEPHLGAGGEAWSGNLDQALRDAAEHRRKTGQRKLVFVDFTGIICTNCRYNEHNIFTQPQVKELFKKYQLAQLVTDTLDAEGDANKNLQRTAFGTIELPLYAILEPLPDGKIKRWGTVGGKINSVERFVQFLEKPLAEGGGKAVAAKE